MTNNKKIIEELDKPLIMNTVVNMVIRAKFLANLDKSDYYIVATNTGINILPEKEYLKFNEQQLREFRYFLENDKCSAIDKNSIDDEIDKFASDLIIKYIDHKKQGE